MSLTILILLSLLSLSLGLGTWTDFTGSFQMTGAAGGPGYVTGTVTWSYTQSKMLLSFNTGTSQTWSETYAWNTTKGYYGSGIDSPQYVFTLGSSCAPNCNSASISSGIPLLNPSGPNLNPPTGTGCQTFTPAASASQSFATSMTASQTQVCSFTLTDGRLFTMTSFTTSAATITQPAGCSCTQAVDIEFLIDHSGSIDDTEMGKFKNFTTNFLSGLTVSPTAINSGMVFFSVPKQSGTNWPMTGDAAIVAAGLKGWAVPCVSGNIQCQGPGTATGYGIKIAADGLYSSIRRVPKILMILTDGATNTNSAGSGCCLSSGTDRFIGCNADIDTNMNYLFNRKALAGYAHNLTIIVVGIGTECNAADKQSCSSSCKYTPHLLRFADNVASNVISVNDWGALQTQVTNLMAITCTSSSNIAQTTCLSTCNGLCVCGGCIPPTGCTNNACFNYSLSGGQCQATANPCPSQTCKTSTCVLSSTLPLTGGCTYSPVDCSALSGGCNGCIKYGCDGITGQCTVPDASGCPAPVDCVQSAWGSWTACTVSCGGGTAVATRTVVTPQANCGAACLGSQQTFACNTQACPTPCSVSAWTAFSPCSVSCGGGTSISTRTILANATNGGALCPALSLSVACNIQLCPIDCVWYAWGLFSPCTVSCGGGNQTQTRSIKISVANGGVDCTGSASFTTSCNTQGCPVDCVWSVWGAYNDCSATCGTGSQSRNRTFATVASNGGASCSGSNTSSQTCNNQLCPISCQWGSWSAWGSCSASCGTGGSQTSVRVVTQLALWGAPACVASDATKTQVCNNISCPIDCSWAGWLAWGACSQTCGGGSQIRNRTTAQVALYGGNDCAGVNVSTQPCNTLGCPVDCAWGAWGAWSACPVSCGSGIQTSARVVVNASLFGGSLCIGLDIQSQVCNQTGCPTPCTVSQWGAWSTCNATCGGGYATQNRSITANATNGGSACPSLTQTTICNILPCPIDCLWFDWTFWSPCSVSCGGGNQTQSRIIQISAAFGGANCTGNTSASQACNTQGCPVDCVWSVWGAYTDCSASCAGGLQSRNRTQTPPAANGGFPCIGSNSSSQACNFQPCPISCQWGSWSAWGSCTVSCGSGGTQTAIRPITQLGLFGATPCDLDDGIQSQGCMNEPCPVDCSWAVWLGWGDCSQTCGGGTQVRARIAAQLPLFGGVDCVGVNISIQPCNTQGCPVNCSYGEWDAWSACTTSCGGGNTTQSRKVSVAALFGGLACDPLDAVVTTVCNALACPIDCIWSPWNDWSSCNATCGGGIRTAARTILQDAANNGLSCGTIDSITSNCNINPCPIDCIGAWGSWATCSCLYQNRTRTYSISVEADFGGLVCAKLGGAVDVEDCNITSCVPIDCIGEWASWNTCSCTSKITQRVFNVSTPASNNGTNCPYPHGSLSPALSCTPDKCPIDCIGIWTDPTSCQCFLNISTQAYIVVTPVQFAGASCPFLNATVNVTSCTPTGCAVDCIGAWGLWGPCSCDNNTQIRLFGITVPTQFDGRVCSEVSGAVSLQPCTPTGCPVDCAGFYSDFSPCNCSTNTTQRTWTQTQANLNNGRACNVTDGQVETTSCVATGCPVPCDGSWSSWGPCSCNTSTSARNFTLVTPAQNGGDGCVASNGEIGYQNCVPTGCPVACNGSWSSWGACACGTDLQNRSYTVTDPAQNGGTPCSNATGDVQYLGCTPTGCPVACNGSWGPWSNCSCITGNQSRSYTIYIQEQNSGGACPQATGDIDQAPCDTSGCPVDCAGSWTTWSNCSCVNNSQVRDYSVTTNPANGGQPCPGSQIQSCTPSNCPVDCVGYYTQPTTCECYTNTSNTTFIITTDAQFAGTPCPAANNTVNSSTGCTPSGCEINCNGSWTSWSTCDCSNNSQIRTFSVSTPAAYGGVGCVAADGASSNQSCSPVGCPVNCAGFYSSFSVCDCLTNTSNRTWTITTNASNNGSECNVTNGQVETSACVAVNCPSDCVGSWSDWGSCSCGSSQQNRTFNLAQNATNGGEGCIATNGSMGYSNCTPSNCPVACNGSWSSWGACACSTSQQNRTYAIETPEQNNGTQCPNATGDLQTTGCTPTGCPIACNGSWGPWSNCSCVTGNQSRSYTIYIQEENSGGACPQATGDIDQIACNTSDCPVGCNGTWSEWSSCSCVSRLQNRTYNATTEPANGGNECPGEQNQPCVPSDCPVDCQGEWSIWGQCPCNGTSPNSSQTRNFNITVNATNNGTECSVEQGAIDTQSCISTTCAIDCIGSWGPWGVCGCDGTSLARLQFRNYSITQDQSNGGKYCDADDGAKGSQACVPPPGSCENYGPSCNSSADCEDSSKCTQDLCLQVSDGTYHCDWSSPVQCGDNSTCSSDSCDEQKGCQYIPLNCDDENACTLDFCDNVTGCYHTNITCPRNDSEWCYEPICDAVTGCGKVQRSCHSGDDKQQDNCTQYICDPNAKSNATACVSTQLCGFDPALIAGIAGGAIAGIAVAAATVALAAASGASYAIATSTGAMSSATVIESPLYVGDGTSGNNLLRTA